MTLRMEASACIIWRGQDACKSMQKKKKKKPWGSRWVQGGVVPLTPLLPASKARLEKKNGGKKVDLPAFSYST